MYSSSENSDSDSGTFKRGKRKATEEKSVKPVIQRQEARRDEKHDRRQRFDTKHESRDDARVEKHSRRSPDRSDKYSKQQSSSYNAKHVRPRSTRSRSRDRHESKNRHSHQSERRKSPRKYAPKEATKTSSERIQDTQRRSHLSEEKYREVKKPSPDAKHLRESKSDHNGSITKKIDPNDYAPAMPSNLKRRSSSPKHTQKSKHHRSKSPNYGTRNYGPSLPKNFELPTETAVFEDHCDLISSDDDSAMTIGPLPASAEMSERDLELEKRKIEIKLKQLDARMEAVNSSDAKHREEWMLELPEIKKVPDMGLSARQFRKNARPDFSDRSSWTKTPNDGNSKKSSHAEKSHASTDAAERTRDLERRRDEDQEKVAKEHKKAHKRNKTLLEIHEKLKKKEVRTQLTPFFLPITDFFSFLTEKG